MDQQAALLIAWSMGTAAVSYGLLAAYLVSLGHEWRSSMRARAMLTAVVLAALWAVVGTLFALSGNAILFVSGAVLDILRYGAWYVFLILLLIAHHSQCAQHPNFPGVADPALLGSDCRGRYPALGDRFAAAAS